MQLNSRPGEEDYETREQRVIARFACSFRHHFHAYVTLQPVNDFALLIEKGCTVDPVVEFAKKAPSSYFAFIVSGEGSPIETCTWTAEDEALASYSATNSYRAYKAAASLFCMFLSCHMMHRLSKTHSSAAEDGGDAKRLKTLQQMALGAALHKMLEQPALDMHKMPFSVLHSQYVQSRENAEECASSPQWLRDVDIDIVAFIAALEVHGDAVLGQRFISGGCSMGTVLQFCSKANARDALMRYFAAIHEFLDWLSNAALLVKVGSEGGQSAHDLLQGFAFVELVSPAMSQEQLEYWVKHAESGGDVADLKQTFDYCHFQDGPSFVEAYWNRSFVQRCRTVFISEIDTDEFRKFFKANFAFWLPSFCAECYVRGLKSEEHAAPLKRARTDAPASTLPSAPPPSPLFPLAVPDIAAPHGASSTEGILAKLVDFVLAKW